LIYAGTGGGYVAGGLGIARFFGGTEAQILSGGGRADSILGGA
jgi:hypothetical protein